MYTDDERIRMFREECAGIKKYQSRIRRIESDLKVLETKMMDVSSPVLDKIGSSPSRKEKSLIEYLERKTYLQDEIDYWNERIRWVKETVASVDSPGWQVIIWRTYMEKQKVADLAEEYLVSRDHIYKGRRFYLLRGLTDERMKELDRLKSVYEDKFE